ncbi:diguanylate cyclase domain-containing protein [Sinanaerobacter chloroacetimidivorans]|uniref:Stage 0 sporulation protein A homolog n=1 Tax=Sinanaerobacter chloroacetimidivorans TaxID=2818044 RepID=A0A8J8B409_9FIRM|nr:diguanylate cyclase [Sinanaerobacter chloroacetimidivorans]MBR0600311.1 diguanylate cyclase [Sinanaerobacter chloroacetimidivorans]
MYKAVLIDDDKENIKIIESALTKYGFFKDIAIFTNPLTAIDEIKVINPDVVFTDVEMPEMSGLELAQYVIDYNPTIKIVFITAYDYYAIEAFELYAVDYLLKPIRMERLDQTIERLMKVRNSKCQADNTEKLEISVFGKMDVFKRKKHVRWNGAKTEELFAYLLHNTGEKVMKDTLVDIMWSGYGYKQALRNMQTAICRVRQSLNELGDHINIEYSCNCYSLKMKNVYFDYFEFKNLIKDIDEINDENIYDAIKALEMYRGDYMETNGYIWSLGKQAAIKNRFYELYIKLLEYCDVNENTQNVMSLLKSSLEKDLENRAVKSLLKKCQIKLKDRISIEKMKYSSEYDLMTDVLNRRAGLALLEQSFFRTLKANNNMIICFIDINCVKEVNDVLGHKAGDELIITTVNCIKKCIRRSDFIIRMGGDEFLIAFLDADIEEIKKVWERIENEYNNINLNMERKYLVSVSYGLVECNSAEVDLCNKESLDNLIELADKRMYDKKKQLKKDLKIIK